MNDERLLSIVLVRTGADGRTSFAELGDDSTTSKEVHVDAAVWGDRTGVRCSCHSASPRSEGLTGDAGMGGR